MDLDFFFFKMHHDDGTATVIFSGMGGKPTQAMQTLALQHLVLTAARCRDPVLAV